jgi:ABC-type transport system involved in cytochrome c biogenesis permease subunit
MPLERITIFCFAASYAVAMMAELVHLFWPGRLQRFLALGFGGAGLIAHTLYLASHPPLVATQSGSMLLLAWILAVFYLIGAIHHRRQVWGVFVLPVVLILIAWPGAGSTNSQAEDSWLAALDSFRGARAWSAVHGGLLLLAAVGVCVAFCASLMYLLQAQRLKSKVPPGQGLRLLSLERLEEMNRRAINLAFPLLTAGVLMGLVLMVQRADQLQGWTDPKILGSALLWVVFALLLYLRYGFHLRGRRLALLTIVAFVLLLVTLASAHTSVPGGLP